MQERSGALLNGSQLQDGKYIIKAALGEGGFGITYRATAVGSRLHPNVAIKELFVAGSQRVDGQVVQPPALSAEGWAKLSANFVREAQTIARLRHPSIVPVYDCFEENNTFYIVMGFVPGDNLDRITRHRGGMLPEAQALRYVAEVADALTVLHASGVLHRDVKPANIIINEQDQAVLIDFGNARDFVADKTLLQSVILTPAFAPPEQFQAQARRGPYTDIYALAATGYWLLTGDLLDTWDSSKVKNDPRLSPAVCNALIHALAFNSQERTADAATFARELFAPLPQLPASPAPVSTPRYQSAPVARPAAPAVAAAYPRPPTPAPPLPPVYNPPPRTGPQPIVPPARSIWQLEGRELWLSIAGSIVVVTLLITLIVLVATHSGNTNSPLVARVSDTPTQARAESSVIVVGGLPPTSAPVPSPTPAPLNTPTSAPAPAPSNTPVIVTNIAALLNGAGLDKLKSYHMSFDNSIGASTSNIEGDFIVPNKARFAATSAGSTLNYIIIGDDIYTNGEGQTYIKVASGGLSLISSYTTVVNRASATLNGGYQIVGNDRIGGVDCIKYHYISSTVANADVWVAKSDQTVRKVKYVSGSGLPGFTLTQINQISDSAITAPPT